LSVGCGQEQAAPPPPKPIAVTVARPVVKDVNDYEEITGMTDAVESVEIRARVTGYLAKRLFKDGDLVETDQVLFEIDKRPYKAALDVADAVVGQREADLKLAKDNYKRFRELKKENPGAVTEQQLFEYQSKEELAEAALKQAKANVESAKLNYDCTEVKSPLAGRISRRMKEVGDLVKADDTLLTNIVCLECVYGYFDVDERTLQRPEGDGKTTLLQKLRRLQNLKNGKSQGASADARVQVVMGLSEEKDFPHQGEIDFVDNRLSNSTGTLRLRGFFEDPTGALAAGMSARFKIEVGGLHKAILVTDRALVPDQDQQKLYVVNAANKVEERNVKTGGLHGGLREIKSGLKGDERVVVKGVQRVRRDAVVEPQTIDMTALAADAKAEK
jgi:RND family efflux transporter MFP subunit